jgi:hypothetical protein
MIACPITAINRSRPPHRGHASTSSPNVRRQLGPEIATASWCRAIGARRRRAIELGRRLRPCRSGRGDHRPAPRRPWREQAVIQHQVDPRSGNHGQTPEQVHGIEAQMGRAVRPLMPQRHPHLSLGIHAEPRVGDGRSQRVSGISRESHERAVTTGNFCHHAIRLLAKLVRSLRPAPGTQTGDHRTEDGAYFGAVKRRNDGTSGPRFCPPCSG